MWARLGDRESPMDVLSPMASSLPRVAGGQFSLSVVVPVYNEVAVLPEFHRRLGAIMESLSPRVEIIYVDDGSRDGSGALLAKFHAEDARVAVIELSRNFGKEIAMTAGLDHAEGDAVIVIDSDLQDPPELISDMIRAWQEGADVVLMRRASRAQESWFKKATARAFYRVIGRMSEIDIPADVGDFRLMSRRAVLAFRRMPERSRFMKGLFAWIGYPSRELVYDRDGRFAGETKWNYWKLWNFALEGITSFSAAPLKIASYVGFLAALVAFGFGMFFIAKTLLYGDPVRGFPTLVVLVLFFGGLQLMALGILGEYIARMFVEVKQRPLYLVLQRRPPSRPIARAGDESLSESAEPWRSH
jgi:polyisoprenyl-phosphate glycosyltransferase